MELSEIKKKYSWLGLCLTVFIAGEFGGSKLLQLVFKMIDADIANNSWVTYICSMIPIWGFGFPLCLLFLRKLPKQQPEMHDVKFKYMIAFYMMITSVMVGANIIGNLIGIGIKVITGTKIANSTIEMIAKQGYLQTLIFAVLLGPIMEELFFRKILIDRIGQYSKRYAIILSGLIFGLFHTNFYQFFYTTLIGVIFAYIYTISGKIRYTMILHMIINCVHGLIPIFLMKHMNLKDLEEIQNMDYGQLGDPELQKKVLSLYANPAFSLFILYAMLILAFIITGMVLLIINRKKMKVDDSASPLNKSNALKTIYLNPGMIIFLIVILAATVYETIIAL